MYDMLPTNYTSAPEFGSSTTTTPYLGAVQGASIQEAYLISLQPLEFYTRTGTDNLYYPEHLKTMAGYTDIAELALRMHSCYSEGNGLSYALPPELDEDISGPIDTLPAPVLPPNSTSQRPKGL